jgi:hypothetical protein
MKKQINIEFELGDQVSIKELNRKGKILSIWINKTGTLYEVRYFDNAEAKTVYFYADELGAGE